ncbi:axotactin-like isoform X2 [Macrosteles quadrilineatus]|uniref:axotactin-like isoform X2 n=1 Tax=Macrosteles quadrilineatus TaxID=74068 RepID=UPI0023E1B85A|nr:axotactin-like isoform X2 [Macrosteles quadrilineatus]
MVGGQSSWGLMMLSLVIFLPNIRTNFLDPYLIMQERCKGVVSRGPCQEWIHKWYFNVSTQACKIFVYGGCRGENVFDSEAECLHYCIGGDHTLPPYLMIPALPVDETTSEAPKITSVRPLVPFEQRGIELTFPETGHHKVFMMAKNNAFIQLDGNRIKTFQLRLCREISFQFRTRLPHGLLVYHSVKDRPEGLDPYALYVIVEKGQLKVVHVFGKHSLSVIVGEGLNRDTWHSVRVRIDVHGARLIAKVDDKTSEASIPGLHKSTNYGVFTDLTSVVLIGGLSPEEKLHGVKYIIESFVGCIKDMVLSAGKAASDLLPIKPLIATKHDNVQEGCINKCKTRENFCFEGSKCINHYNELSCDCFGTGYEGELCDVYTATILTFRGSSYVSYRVYDWKDRVHSNINTIGLHFKTRFDDSALFYASGEWSSHHHIAASLYNGSVVVEVDLGGDAIITKLGFGVNDNEWHNLTISHHHSKVTIYLDQESRLITLQGGQPHLYIDPEIYIGGGPELHKKSGLSSLNNFVGSLKYVYFNEISILYELKKGNPKVHYIGVLDPMFFEYDIKVIPITFPFSVAHIRWPIHTPEFLQLSFEFKSSRSMAILATAEVQSSLGTGQWELRMVNEEIRFEIIPEINKNITHLTTVKFDTKDEWHTVELIYNHGQVDLMVDYKSKTADLFGLMFLLKDSIIIGSGVGGKSSLGLVGCMQKISVNGEIIEPRFVIRSNHTQGHVSLDNCELVDPCKSPNACEHGGICSVKEDHLSCDCKETGYVGKNCHFAKFRKTCEELALLGYTKPDVYLIDIDGNGRFPPAHVKCEFQSLEDSTKTIVEHNLPSQVDVRSSAETDFSFDISYREFSSEMLTELISHSLYCSQFIKYDCYKAPLELHSATWFISAAQNGTVDYLGSVKRGSCTCGVNRTCVSPELNCNCDISEAKWLSDEGYYINSDGLGITKMVFLQQKDLDEDALGRITLGPLECVETNTQKYVVTFTTSQSYIEVPGWRKGDIAFSFRTTGEKAILLYQPPIRPHYPSFMVALTSEFHLTFNFTMNTGRPRALLIKSSRRLNSGEWQKIWIDYNKHHVRFMINTDYEMVDLLPEEEFGPFEGSMFIGGATDDLLVGQSVRKGLIGCFRGLVVNGEVLDIYSYMSVHLSEIIKDCKPSCDPNPCKNGAHCKELWSTFQCVCENPWAYIGKYCQTSINENGITLVTRESFFKKNYLFNVSSDEKMHYKALLTDTVLLNLRTYDHHSLILHANDHLNNFLQLYITGGTKVVLLFNHFDVIHNVTVDYPGLNSGKSVQIAVERRVEDTVLHVNNHNASIPVGVRLLTEYSNKPWNNSEMEVLAPQRPPAPPTDYFQVILGGYDRDNLLHMDSGTAVLDGYIGCIRGLKIGSVLMDLTKQLEINGDSAGIVAGCRMRCDEVPCKNQGICIEDFQKNTSSCDCEFTSYYGEFCGQEKGADFSGESVLQRKFVLEGPVTQIKVQLAFSSGDDRQRNTVVLLLQTENKRSYYLLVALSSEGELIFEEDREGANNAYGARIKDRYFLNGARHSVYYLRNNDTAMLRVDRETVPLVPIPVLSLTEVPEGHLGANEVQIGGLNTSDPRFAAYKSYSGCLSNVFLEVNNASMKPLDEYMLFTKTGSEEVNVMNSHGVRSAQCAFFEATHKPRPGPSLNVSLGKDATLSWVVDPPRRNDYKSTYSDISTEENETGKILFIIATSLFCIVILGTLWHVWSNHRQWKKRRERRTAQAIKWHNGQQLTPGTAPLPPLKVVRSRSVSETPVYWVNGNPNRRRHDPVYKIRRSKSVPQPIDESKLLIGNGTELKPVLKTTSAPGTGVRFRPRDDERSSPPNTIKEERSAEEEDEEENQELIDHSSPETNVEEADDSLTNEEKAVDIPPDTIPEEEEQESEGEEKYKEVENEENEDEEDKELKNPMFIEVMDSPKPIANGLGQKLLENTDVSVPTNGMNNNKFPTILEVDESDFKEPDIKPRYRPLKNLFPVTKISPVHFSSDQRMFLNPISYLGGPRIPPDKSNVHLSKSKESIVSVD